MVHHAVAEVRGEDFAQLGPLNKKTDRSGRFVAAFDQGITQRQQVRLLPRFKAQGVGRVALVAAAGDVLPLDVLALPPDAVLLDVTMDDIDGWETARRIRARGVAGMPIIMVSANAFENRPDKLAEAGAQAFVDKPVIESELLVALQRHLQLEWVAELPVPGWAPTPQLQPQRLPEEFAVTLTRLAQLGHAQGLQQALARLLQRHPACAAQVDALRTLVERYAFDDLLAQLRGADDSTESGAL